MASTTDLPLPVQDHGGNTRQVCASLGLEEVLDFSASINPLGQPPGLRDHLFAHWEEVAHYPDRDCDALVAALAAHYGTPPECLVAGNGSAELIALLLRALSPRRLLLSPPDFGLYREVAPPGLPVVEVPRREQHGFAPDLPALAAAVGPGDLVLLSNPGNPSGHYSPPGDLAGLHAACAARRAHLAVDEAFADFQDGPTCLPRVASDPHLTVLRSLTKFYGIPGLRLGFLAAAPEPAAAVRRLLVPWSVNALAQRAGRYCLADAQWPARSVAAAAELRRDLSADLAALPGLRPLGSAANYLLVALEPPGPPADRLYAALAQRGILVRHCGSFGLGQRYVRVAVRPADENRRLVTVLAELLGHTGNG